MHCEHSTANLSYLKLFMTILIVGDSFRELHSLKQQGKTDSFVDLQILDESRTNIKRIQTGYR